MKTELKSLVIIAFILSSVIQLLAQGYIVPNGVITNYSGAALRDEISVVHDPTNFHYTGFALHPIGITPPSTYPNTFSFDYILDVGVRVFQVALNAPVSLQPIVSGTYTELTYPNSYVFQSGIPFYVGLYTGNQSFAPPNGIYGDPLFGWAKLVNNQGTIQLLDSAIEYGGGGIYAGTQNIIPVPEPSGLAVFGVGTLFLGFYRRRNFSR